MHLLPELLATFRRCEPPRITVTGYIIVLLTAVALLPTLLVEIPAMLDYPNHLARMHLLADRGTPNENPYYEISFAFYPNLAMDLIVPQLAKIMSVQNAGWLFFLLAQLLVLTGAIALEVARKHRHEFSAFAALLCLHSMPFSLGLVNFEFGLGVALWGLAAWIAFEFRKWYLRFAVHSLFVSALFVSHFFALGVYGLTLGLYEIALLWRHRWKLDAAVVNFSIIATPVLVLLVILYAIGGALGGTENEWVLKWKLVWVAFFLNGYNVALSVGSITALTVVLGYLVFRRCLQVLPMGYWIGFGFLIVYIAMPFKLFDSRMADIRLVAAAFLVWPAFLTIRQGNPANVAGFVVSALIVLNASYAAQVWLSYRSQYAAMKASFALIPPASFILVGNSRSEGSATLLTDAPMYRAPVLAVHYAKAFVSSLYTIAGTVPVEVRPDLKHLDVSAVTESYIPPTLTTLRALARGQHVVDAPGYLRNWTRDFEFLYLVGPRVDSALPDVLDELAGDDRFTLYAVRRPPVPTNASNAAGLP